jgi:hypothetical protein
VDLREGLFLRSSEEAGELGSTVGFPAVANGGDVDGALGFVIEKYPVIATAEAKTDEGSFKLLHFACAVGEVAVDTVKNLHRRFSINSA